MEVCSKCYKYRIQNKYYKLCHYCNKLRLDEKRECSKSKRRVLQKSDKGQERSQKKRQFREKIFGERSNVCSGCSCQTNLTLSHTIPVSKRKDLEFEPENIHIECMQCHTIWEHGTTDQKQTLFSFESKKKYILEVDKEYWHRKFA